MNRTSLVVFAVLAASPAAAQLCAPVHYVATGIGDGCTTVLGGAVFNFVSFKDVFTPSCDQHDLCYSRLGNNADTCDNRFLADMEGACRSRFNPLLLAPLYSACVGTAGQYFTAVRAFGTSHFPEHQRNVLALSRNLETQVNAGQCGTSPELTNLFTQDLINTINNTWLAAAGRLPTVYEFFATINAGAPSALFVDANAQWQAQLQSSAQAAASVRPPVITLTTGKTATTAWVGVPFTFDVDAVLHTWNFVGTQYSEPLHFPLWNSTWYIEGYVTAVNRLTRAKNLKVFKAMFSEKGSCGPYYGKPVLDPENPICQ
jgi:hypothetical protein